MQKILLLTLIISLNVFSQSPTFSFPKHLKHSSIENTKTQNASTTSGLRDSSYSWNWDNAGLSWGYPTRAIFGYNTANKENSCENSTWNGSLWDNNSRVINYLFDGSYNYLSGENQNWNGSSWMNSYKTVNTYDASNNQVSSTRQNWNTGNLSWKDYYRTVNTFDASNNILTTTTETWNAGASTWDNFYKSTATYNGNNEYTSSLDQIWNTSANSWKNYSQSINFVYSGGDLLRYEYEMWNTASLTFEPSAKSTTTYDGNHHSLSYLSQSWSNSSNSWEDGSKTTYTYDANGNQITLLRQSWNAMAGTWVNAYRQYDYYASSVTVGMNELTSQKNVFAYPNPFANELIIESISGGVSSNYVLLDDLGHIVFQGTTSGDKTILNTSALEKGFYTLTLINDKGITKSQKLIR
ncbi:MAG: type sorting protein [Bacteroidota bacterium]|jgi:hypothetical protein|nr:type sorting protein [Bacteroidota bacterium]